MFERLLILFLSSNLPHFLLILISTPEHNFSSPPKIVMSKKREKTLEFNFFLKKTGRGGIARRTRGWGDGELEIGTLCAS